MPRSTSTSGSAGRSRRPMDSPTGRGLPDRCFAIDFSCALERWQPPREIVHGPAGAGRGIGAAADIVVKKGAVVIRPVHLTASLHTADGETGVTGKAKALAASCTHHQWREVEP